MSIRIVGLHVPGLDIINYIVPNPDTFRQPFSGTSAALLHKIAVRSLKVWCHMIYTVQPGDTLNRISEATCVPVESVIYANQIEYPYRLAVAPLNIGRRMVEYAATAILAEKNQSQDSQLGLRLNAFL